MSLRPIEIVGGGLAGLSLGWALRRHDVPVTLHEAGAYPRHRVCGEFIAGLADSTIARLGLAPVLAQALHHEEVAWFSGASPPQIQRLPQPALGLSRHTLDARLAELFVAAGGVLHLRTRRTDLNDRPGRVIATGRRRRNPSPWLGLKIHVRNFKLTRDLEMHLGDHCYVGLTQVDAEVVNVCGLFRRRAVPGRGGELLLNFLRAGGLTALADSLARAAPEDGSFCAVAGIAFDRRVARPGGLVLGDAAAMIPPFTGNGMAMAFQSAAAALPPLLRYARGDATWTEACAETDRVLRARFRVRLASAGALHSFLLRPRRQRWFAALGRSRLLPFGSLYASLH